MRADGVGSDAVRHEPDDADRRLHEAEEALQEAGMSAETGSPPDRSGREGAEPVGRSDDEIRDDVTDAAGA